MATASLQLLKGKAAAKAAEPETPEAPEEELPPTEEETTPEVPEENTDGDEEVEVDVDAMTGPQLDALVKEHGIDVPTSWWKQENGVKKLTVPEKKAWLKAQFEDAEDGEEPETVVGTSTPVEKAPPETQASKEVPASKSKSKAVAKAKASVTGEVVESDALSDMVHEIENLKEKSARDMVAQLAEAAELTYFKLGGVLSVIQANGWFTPYASFREFVESEHGLHYRKAMYWVGIYNDLTEAKIPWAKVKHLGWTKLKEIAGILSLENLEEWVTIAEQNNTLQLIELVSNAKKKANSGSAITDQSEPVMAVTTKTFKVHADQKATIEAAIEKAREAAGTTVDTVALEFICLDFLGSKQKKVAEKPLRETLQKQGLELALEAFAEAFPDVELTAEVPGE